MPDLYAHRGVTTTATENTLEAFSEARSLGADGVELDVRHTKDGAIVVHHDASIDGLWAICDLNASDLPPYVPLLSQVYEVVGDLMVNVELKNSAKEPGYDSTGAFVDAVVHAVEAAGGAGQTMYSSFDLPSLQQLRSHHDRVEIGWLLAPGADLDAASEVAPGYGFVALHPFVLDLTLDTVANAHLAGLAVNTWTVNSEADLHRALSLDVDIIITDALALAQQVRRGDMPWSDDLTISQGGWGAP